MVGVSAAVALAMGAAAGSAPLMATLAGSALLGVVYSADLPLLRWKRSPVLAAACILAVRCGRGGRSMCLNIGDMPGQRWKRSPVLAAAGIWLSGAYKPLQWPVLKVVEASGGECQVSRWQLAFYLCFVVGL